MVILSSPKATGFFPGARDGRGGGQGTEEGYKEGTEVSDPSSQLGEDGQEGWERDSEAAASGAGDTGHLTVKGSPFVEKRAAMDRREDRWRPNFSAGTSHYQWPWAGWPRSSGRKLAGDERVKESESSLLDA